MTKAGVLNRVWDVLMAMCLNEETRQAYRALFDEVEDAWKVMFPKWVSVQDLDALEQLIDDLFTAYEMPDLSAFADEMGEVAASLAFEVCTTAQHGVTSIANAFDPRPLLRFFFALLTTELMPLIA